MSIAIELSDQQALALAEASQRLEVKEADLAIDAGLDLVAKPHDDFEAAAARVLEKNRELDRRLG